MTKEEAIERFENVKANALVQKANGVSEYWQNEIDGTIEAIDMAIEALSADAVQGEWIIRENGNKECSLCGHERQNGWDYFCGYCGARMYKGGDDE